ncbi:MAG: PilZ domain-containing protein [Candidatus Omnitrophica bacterium]|nr:PilZ domain-containing protein [Candidatus Omnitrophota bacterium]
MVKWEGLDRRRFPRINYPCLVVIHNNEEGQDVLLTHTENIGLGGVCVIFRKNVKVFCPVELEVDLMDFGEHIKCSGRVVWNVQRKVSEHKKPLFYDIGIEFQNLSETDRARIEEIVIRLEDKQKEI